MALTNDEKILALRSIEGFDVDFGLKTVMNMIPVYFKVLRIFVKNERNEHESFDQLINSGEIGDFNVLVHGYKGSLRNIGALNLSNLAQQLETFAGNNDIAGIKANLPAFKDGIRLLADNIEKILGES